MLHSLSVSNIVLIERLTLTFDTGLTVLTGETGAGKSILLDALGLALGKEQDPTWKQEEMQYFVKANHNPLFLEEGGKELVKSGEEGRIWESKCRA